MVNFIKYLCDETKGPDCEKESKPLDPSRNNNGGFHHKHSSATKKKKGCCVGRWMLWWDNGGNSGETEVEEKSNQGPWIPVSVFAGYGTVNRTPLPQPLKRTSPIYRTHNYTFEQYLKFDICF